MKAFNYEIRRIEEDSEVKRAILNKAEINAKTGLVQARLELTHHTLLLNQLTENKVEELEKEEKESDTDREIRLTREAIERDKRSINNWETQLKAIHHERNT